MRNESGLRPLGRAILLETYEPEIKAGVIVMPDSYKDRMDMVEQRAVVLELGPHCYPDEPARCKPGDKVLVGRMAGAMARGPADGKTYRLVNDRDVYCQIVKEKENG